jgi:hypothetical protein
MKTPTLEEVTDYCLERNSSVEPQVFLDHYEMLGWTWGKHNKPIKSWKACVRTWETLDKKRKAERKTGDIIDRLTDKSWADEAVIIDNKLLERK